MLDSISAKTLHRDARLLGIESGSLVTCYRCKARQSKNVIDSTGPHQGIVGKIAFPIAGMVRSQRADFTWLQNIDRRAIQDPAQLKLTAFLVKWPTMVKRERLGWMKHITPDHNDLCSQIPQMDCTNRLTKDKPCASVRVQSSHWSRKAAVEVDNSQFAVDRALKARLQELARHILDERDRRHWYFPRAMFDETPWQMLLVLYVSDSHRQSSQSLSSSVLAAPSTGSRWIDYLATEDLVTRHVADDESRSMVELTPKGLSSLELYLTDRQLRTAQHNKPKHAAAGAVRSRLSLALVALLSGILCGGIIYLLTSR